MKILITGTQGLAAALYECYNLEHDVTTVSKQTGHDINDIGTWGLEFVNYDCVFNNAYHGFTQVKVLEFFYKHWKDDVNKHIINIGSRCICYKRTENDPSYWNYKIHKLALQSAYDMMQLTAHCDIKMFNPGPIDTAMVSHLDVQKMSAQDLAQKIKLYASDRCIKRVDLWI